MKAASSVQQSEDIPCHVCGAAELRTFEDFGEFHRVTSDCRLWPKGGRLGLCACCGCVQSIIDPIWRSHAEKIYDNYSIYEQGGGQEQSVFESITGKPTARSNRILDYLTEEISLADVGRLLDVGCGNGSFLSAFSPLAPNWALAGTEFDGKYKSVIEGIPGVEGLYLSNPIDVPGTFDLVTLIHVLEHIPDPIHMLSQLRSKLNPNGLLFIEVPDLEHNPFDLLIADHASHFTRQTLTRIAIDAGFSIRVSSGNWVAKELSFLLSPDESEASMEEVESAAYADLVRRHLDWMRSVLTRASEIAAVNPFGLFGTSISATWLYRELEATGYSVDFFVDEDPNRSGKQYMGKPVYRPEQVPVDGRVFLVLASSLATSIFARLKSSGGEYFVPPEYQV